MPKDRLGQNVGATRGPHPHPAAPGAPSPTGEGAEARAGTNLEQRPGETCHTTAHPKWRLLRPEAQRMRRSATQAESILWEHLRNGALGVHFRRQHVVDRFVVDFCCLRAKVIVEVDGPIHDRRPAQDAERDARLTQMGYRVLRVRNEDVLHNVEAVLAVIRATLT